MSKYNDLKPYQMSSHERVVELNGPEIAELFSWYNQVKKIDSLTAEETKSVVEALEMGPLFEMHQPLLVTINQIKYVERWIKTVNPSSPLTEVIKQAFASALEGKRRPDLKALEEKDMKSTDPKKK